MDIIWLVSNLVSIACIPMLIQRWRLGKRTNAMNIQDLFTMTVACCVPVFNMMMFFKSYIEPEERYWHTTSIAITILDDMDRRITLAIKNDDDMLAVLLYGEPLMRYNIPNDKLKSLRYDGLKQRVISHMIQHCELQGHSVRICEDNDNIRFLQVKLGGLKSGLQM